MTRTQGEMTMVTRLEAAAKISQAIETNDYSASVWSPEGESGPVRVYVTIPAASWKKKSREIGYVEILRSGDVESHLEKQSGSIMGLLPNLEISPAPASQVAQRQSQEIPDDPIDRMEREAQRELGRTGELPGA
jgi:hypothetical protein